MNAYSEVDPAFPRDGSWFIVLPDRDCDLAPLSLHSTTRSAIRHPSGRPWIVGNWSQDELVSAESPSVRMVLLGAGGPVQRQRAEQAATAVTCLADLDRVSGSVPGSFHLVAACADQIRVQGTLSGVRRVFFTQVGDVTVAADRADVLAQLVGDSPATDRLALRLAPQPPYPLNWMTMWARVQPVQGGCYLRFRRVGGGTEVVRWWTPPEPVESADHGVEHLRSSLAAAVEARVTAVGGDQRVGADLSGGLDSTTLSFLARRSGSRLVTCSQLSSDPANDDAQWADLAAERLGDVERVVVAPDDRTGSFSAARDTGDGLDEPPASVGIERMVVEQARLLVQRGVRLHLAGHGGDELLRCTARFLHTIARRRPVVAARHLRGHTAMRRWPAGALARGIVDRRPFARWLAEEAAGLSSRPGSPGSTLGWGFPLSMPDWATSASVDAVRDLARALPEDLQPLAPSRGQHATVESMQSCGLTARHVGQCLDRQGVVAATPFLDDQVIEAVLPVALHERATPWEFKPLLTRSMCGIIPPEFSGRVTKGDSSTDLYRGFRSHRSELLELCKDSLLHQLGLVDAAQLRRAIVAVPSPDVLAGVARTLACEAWLRNRGAPTEPAIGVRSP